jgi:hypothetical protein
MSVPSGKERCANTAAIDLLVARSVFAARREDVVGAGVAAPFPAGCAKRVSIAALEMRAVRRKQVQSTRPQ